MDQSQACDVMALWHPLYLEQTHDGEPMAHVPQVARRAICARTQAPAKLTCTAHVHASQLIFRPFEAVFSLLRLEGSLCSLRRLKNGPSEDTGSAETSPLSASQVSRGFL
ncbi:hypothetical protein L345_15324, partial [Ophiophagus hannah]